MTDREAMKQALEALGWTDEWRPDGLKEQAIAALRERLAQPEQEPVAWLYEAGNDRTLHWYKPLLYGTPLYAAPPQRTWAGSGDLEDSNAYLTPPQRKPLTDEELEQVFPAIATYHEANKTLYRSIARAIEAAHGIKGEA